MKSLTTNLITGPVEKSVRNTEIRIAAFQKEARKLSGERKIDNPDITPVRSVVNRSISPADKKNYTLQQENNDLKDLLKKVQMERDILRAWKENVLKLPGNFSEDSNIIIKELENYKKQLSTQNKVLNSKLLGLVSSTQKFLKETSAFQKCIREKEGFNSVNFYETERHKLELKLKELSEIKAENDLSPLNSPSGKILNSIDLSQFTEKFSSYETENKILKSQVREYKKSVKTLEIKCAELENFRKQAEKEKQIIERKSRVNINTPNAAKKNSVFYQKIADGVKNWAEGRFNEINEEFELKLLAIQQKLVEKENCINEVRSRFTDNLMENLNVLIAMNEKLKNSNAERSSDETFKVQIENFEYIIEQNRVYTEIKVQELNEAIELLECERNQLMKVNQVLEKESFQLKSEVGKSKELENEIKVAKTTIAELEEKNKVLSARIRHLKQKELDFDQITYEKSIMRMEISKLSEDISQKEKLIIDLQQTLKSEARQANSLMENLIFKEKATKTELELTKIENLNFKNDVCDLEEKNQKLIEQVSFLDAQIRILHPSNTNIKANESKISIKSNPISPIISESSASERIYTTPCFVNGELEEERKNSRRYLDQMSLLKDHIRELEKKLKAEQMKLGESDFMKDIIRNLIFRLPKMNSEIEGIIKNTMSMLEFSQEEIQASDTMREDVKKTQALKIS
ncbi:hypothetical protein SteCoe_22083 [Stentor coeruleus]|uniref:Uncharacterized protein n=1 Tax=Stentor coeruleus TaxID=5963 RepID=A0A1R2BMZ3_9CILI|nr:hypothetical protein SteCoe_22083 [Stentor coeruleus]